MLLHGFALLSCRRSWPDGRWSRACERAWGSWSSCSASGWRHAGARARTGRFPSRPGRPRAGGDRGLGADTLEPGDRGPSRADPRGLPDGRRLRQQSSVGLPAQIPLYLLVEELAHRRGPRFHPPLRRPGRGRASSAGALAIRRPCRGVRSQPAGGGPPWRLEARPPPAGSPPDGSRTLAASGGWSRSSRPGLGLDQAGSDASDVSDLFRAWGQPLSDHRVASFVAPGPGRGSRYVEGRWRHSGLAGPIPLLGLSPRSFWRSGRTIAAPLLHIPAGELNRGRRTSRYRPRSAMTVRQHRGPADGGWRNSGSCPWGHSPSTSSALLAGLYGGHAGTVLRPRAIRT